MQTTKLFTFSIYLNSTDHKIGDTYNWMILIRGTLISKLTDIPITDISAIKSTDSNIDTDITTSIDSSLLLLQMLQI